MLKGRIRNIPLHQSYGWISYRDDNNILTDYFIHMTDYEGGNIDEWNKLKSDILVPRAQIWVEFEVVESDRGPRAGNVRRI